MRIIDHGFSVLKPVFEQMAFCYALIKSLSMSEKRTFTLYARRHIIGAENRYMHIFQALEGMDSYDEHALRKYLHARGLQTKWLKADLNYTYNLVLDHLRNLHKDGSALAQVMNYLAEAEILFYKGLADACRKQLFKAKALCKAIEAWDMLLRVLHWERRLAIQHPELGLMSYQLVQEQGSVLQKQVAFTEAMQLYEDASKLRVEAVSTRTSGALKAFDRLLKHPLFGKNPRSLDVLTYIRLLQVQCMRFYAGRDLAAELRSNQLIISTYKKHPILRDTYALDFAAIQARVLSILKNTDPAACYRAIHAFRVHAPKADALQTAALSAYVFVQSYMVELSALLSQSAYYPALRLLPEIEKGLAVHRAHIGDAVRCSFAFMITFTCFANGEYVTARSNMHDTLQHWPKGIRPDLHHFARLLDLMIHLQLGNHSNIRSAYASVAYQFKKEPKRYAVENSILKYFSHPKYYSGKFHMQHLEQLETDLHSISHKGRERLALGYIDFFAWIRSRKQNVPMAFVK